MPGGASQRNQPHCVQSNPQISLYPIQSVQPHTSHWPQDSNLLAAVSPESFHCQLVRSSLLCQGFIGSRDHSADCEQRHCDTSVRLFRLRTKLCFLCQNGRSAFNGSPHFCVLLTPIPKSDRLCCAAYSSATLLRSDCDQVPAELPFSERIFNMCLLPPVGSTQVPSNGFWRLST